jgi:hypothetical protein
MALLAREHMERTGAETSFRGFGLARLSYGLDSFTCDGCENACAINRVRLEGEERPLLFGGRCDKYDERRRAPQGMEDLFAFREQALFAELRSQAGRPAPRNVSSVCCCGSCSRNPTVRPGERMVSPLNSESTPARIRNKELLPEPFSPNTPILAP